MGGERLNLELERIFGSRVWEYPSLFYGRVQSSLFCGREQSRVETSVLVDIYPISTMEKVALYCDGEVVEAMVTAEEKLLIESGML